MARNMQVLLRVLTQDGDLPMRIASFAFAIAATTVFALPAQAQRVPVWRFAQDQQFIVPKCVAPARLVETRTASGRVVWRCVTPK